MQGHKQGSTWNGGTGPSSEAAEGFDNQLERPLRCTPHAQVVEPSPESYQPWADAQPWFPPPQPQFWPAIVSVLASGVEIDGSRALEHEF